MRLLLCYLFAIGLVGACVSQHLPGHGTGGGGQAAGSGGSSGSTGGSSGSGGCAGAPMCPQAGCTFAKVVANCSVEYTNSDSVAYTTTPCGGYDVLYETQDPDTENAYFFDPTTGKIIASVDYEDAGFGETCSGPTDFVPPISCDPPRSALLTDCPTGAGGTSTSGSGGSGT